MPGFASLLTLWDAWTTALTRPRDMTLDWTCCGTPMLDRKQLGLGRTAGYDLVLHACAHCGMRWMNVASNAADAQSARWVPPRWVPVSQRHLGMLLDARPGIERAAALEAWVDESVRP